MTRRASIREQGCLSCVRMIAHREQVHLPHDRKRERREQGYKSYVRTSERGYIYAF